MKYTKRTKTTICLVALLGMTMTSLPQTTVGEHAEQSDTLTAFIRQNPHAVCLNIVYEGTQVYLSADDDNILLNLSVANPQLQMRLLMMPTTICIDPSGKKRQKYRVVLPSARDVMEEMEQLRPKVPDGGTRGNECPDIMPILQALSSAGAVYEADGRAVKLGYQRFHIELDRENALVNYYVLIPKSQLMADKKLKEKWALGVCSDVDMEMGPPEEPEAGMGMMPPSSDSDDDDALQRVMQGNIRSWRRFSIDEVNNANATPQDTDGLCMQVNRLGEYMQCSLTTTNPRHQLSFLMQGMRLTLSDQGDTVEVCFPDAMMVRDKMKRHPNEVKPTFRGDSIGEEVRPDLQPLIAALVDTVVVIRQTDGSVISSHDFDIRLDKKVRELHFIVQVPWTGRNLDAVDVSISSAPVNVGKREFTGSRLSGEGRHNPNGLGEAPTKGEDRRIEYNTMVKVER